MPSPSWSFRFLLLVPALALASPRAEAADIWTWIKREIFDRIDITGSRTLSYHNHDVQGDREAFNLLNYSGQGGEKFTDIGFMNVMGRNVGGSINFSQQVETGRFQDPQQQRLSVDYNRKPFQINLGDIHGSMLNTNRFASFNKLLKGGMATYRSGRFQMKGLYSQARANARTISIAGNNSAGPYYLQVGQVIRGSESVRVDGQEMQLGRDYVINYELGAITFIDRIIAPTSTILVTFEALGFNSQRGTIQGAGMTYDMGKVGRLGITAMKQDVGGGGGLSSRLERFQGSGAPSTPYYLEFEPVPGQPITVRLDGVIQIEGTDYTFDSLNPSIFYFTRFIPLTSTIDVSYTPRPTQALDGNRQVWGLDWRIPFGKEGKGGFLSLNQATGRLDSPANPLEGTARGVEANYRTGLWEIRGSVRRIPRDYVSVETRGFNRNEDAADWGLKYAASPWTLDMENDNSSITLRSIDSGGNITFQNARATRFRTTASLQREVAQPWNLEFVRLKSHSAGFDTSVDTYSLYTSRTFGRLITRWDLENQNARGPVSTGGGAPTIKDIALKTARLDTSYTAGKSWAFGLRTSVSAIDVDNENGLGKDVSLSVNYEPSAKFGATASYSVSDSGQLATLGAFNNGFGFGYNGNGFSGGTTGTGFTTGATDVKLLQLLTRWQVTPRFGLTAQAVQSRYTGSVTSNTETRSYDFGADLDLGRSSIFSASVNTSDTDFVGSSQKAKATNYYVSLSGSPPGRWSYHLGLNGLMTGGNSQFTQDGNSWDGNLIYKLDPKQRLVFSFIDGRTTGYLGQTESYTSLAYVYQLFRNVALVGSYKIRKVLNLDTTQTSGAYKSRGFDLELTFSFTP